MIAIIGAGLSGLMAAKTLNERGINFKVFDKNDRIGGRVQTDHIDGFLLDHGFQVLLDSYPQIRKNINTNKMMLRGFAPGARIYQTPGNAFIVGDPLRKPNSLISTITAPIGSLLDKLKIIKLRFLNETKIEKTEDFLKSLGFSKKIIKNFFKPFFSGVFLEKELRTDSNYFLFLYNRFSKGIATLPKNGMAELPKQIAHKFTDKIFLNKAVKSIHKQDSGYTLSFENDPNEVFEKVIMATEAPALEKFFPDIVVPKNKRVVTTVYFQSNSKIDHNEFLLLNGSGSGRVNHIAILSSIQKSYAPKGTELISVNILDTEDIDPDKIKQEIENWNLFSTRDWQHIKTYKINYAQPDTFWSGRQNIKINDKLILAGDFTQTPSIEGAMRAGEKAAQILIQEK